MVVARLCNLLDWARLVWYKFKYCNSALGPHYGARHGGMALKVGKLSTALMKFSDKPVVEKTCLHSKLALINVLLSS